MNVTVENVTFSYDGRTPVLEDVSLDVPEGSLVGLIGPNGSGKSTLLKLTSGVLRPSRGRIRLGGVDVRSLSARVLARRLAMVAQDRPIGFEFTVREVVAMGRTPYVSRFGRESRADRRAIRDAMSLADVEDLAGRSIREISGGERQRVFLALALAQQPSVLLLDEPTTHLDLGHQVRFLAIVRRRAAEGCTVLLAIHDLTMAGQTVDRVGLIERGRIQATGEPGRVLTPANLRETFGVEVHVGRDPATGASYVVPRFERRSG
jgi:iron complex transport system ATP-binding protein